MSGCQKTTVLVLLGAVIVVFWALVRLLNTALDEPEASASPFVLHTPTATATSTLVPLETRDAAPPTHMPSPTYTATTLPTETATATPVPPSPTPPPSPTLTQTPPPSPTPVPQPTVPAAVSQYWREFAGMVETVEGMGLLAGSSVADQHTADQLRGIYRRLHEMVVPEGAWGMHLAFTVYVSVLEEKCLCRTFADAHSGDAQGTYYRQCEDRAGVVASEVLKTRFLPARDEFLERYSLSAQSAGFPL